MAEQQIALGWLHTDENIKFAPKTLSQIIYDEDGTLYAENIKNRLDNIEANYLPLKGSEDGIKHIIQGPLVLTEGENFGTNFPSVGFNGQIYFKEDTLLYVPEGGQKGQVLLKTGSEDNEYDWKFLIPNPEAKNQVLLSGDGKLESNYWSTSVPYADRFTNSVTINGLEFFGNESALQTVELLTPQWGEARNISIQDFYGEFYSPEVEVNGSEDITLILPEKITATAFFGNLKGNIIIADDWIEGFLVGNVDGNASSATILQTPRNFTIGSTTYDFNGSADVTWTHEEIGATVSNTCQHNLDGILMFNTTVNGVTSNSTSIPVASKTRSGIIDTKDQIFSGLKTFDNNITICGNSVTNNELIRMNNVHLTEYGVFPSSDTIKTRLNFNSADNVAYSGLVHNLTSDGKNKTCITNYSPIRGRNGDTEYAQIYIYVDKNKNCEAGVTNGNGVGEVVFMGAAWNDYAEFRKYRESINEIPYGRVVIENGDDSLSLSQYRLQKGGNICSDTYGFAIGKTEISTMPIAVCGRVLAYPYENKNEYQPGDAVCSGPNGTISKMTDKEIKEYPDRIIGYVSSIPNYELWGRQQIQVNGRIWIKVV